MTSKKLFWSNCLFQLKQRLWAFFLYFGIVLCVMPIYAFLMVNSFEHNSSVVLIGNRLKYYNLMGSIWVFTLLSIGAAVLFALQGFQYLHHQNQVDLYDAIPIKKSSRFWMINLCSFLYFVTGYAVGLILTNLVIAINGYWENSMAGISFLSLLMGTMVFLAAYAVSCIAVLQSGNSVAALFFAALLHLAEIIVWADIYGMMNAFFITAYLQLEEFLQKSCLTPLAVMYRCWQNCNSLTMVRANLLWEGMRFPLLLLLLQTILYMTIAYLLFRKRRHNAFGKNVVYPFSATAIRLYVMLTGSIVVALLFIDVNVKVGIVGLLLGLLFLHFIAQGILEKKLSALKDGIISSAILAFLTVGGYMICYYDVLGYDAYVPKRSEISSFSVSFTGDYCYDFYDEDLDYCNGQKYILDNLQISDPEQIDKMVLIMQGLVANESLPYLSCRAFSRDELFSNGSYGNMTVCYRLQNGKEVTRHYYVPYELGYEEEIFRNIYDLPEYKECINTLRTDSVQEAVANTRQIVVNFQSFNFDRMYYGEGIISGDMGWKLFDAIAEDMDRRSADFVLEELPIGALYMVLQLFQDDAMYSRTLSFEIPVYACDALTLAVLDEQQIDYSITPKPELVKVLTINYCDDELIYYDAESASVEMAVGLIREVEILPGDPYLERILDNCVVSDATYLIPDVREYAINDYDIELQTIKGDYIYLKLRKECDPAVISYLEQLREE
ncbi:MAG: hypothetical protein ACI4DU_05575 [Lachnospiraceae bacterium]